MSEAASRGLFEPPRLDDTRRAAMAAGVRAHPAVTEGWCVATTVQLDEQRRYEGCMLIARIDPQRMKALQLDEDDVNDQLRELVATLVPPNCLPLAWTSFTTEPLPVAGGDALRVLEAGRVANPHNP